MVPRFLLNKPLHFGAGEEINFALLMKNRMNYFLITLICLTLISCDNTTVVYPDIPDEEPDKEYVDLGLSVKWAVKNIGAESPMEIGNFYAWGEKEEKSEYTKENYAFYDEESMRYTKYVDYWTSLDYDEEGNKLIEIEGGDGIEVLLPIDDVATQTLGKNWRIPTQEECNELMMNCELSTVPILENGKALRAYTLTGPNGNSITFINNGSYSDYGYTDHLGFQLWTNYRSDDMFATTIAVYGTSWLITSEERHHGLPIRAVYIEE